MLPAKKKKHDRNAQALAIDLTKAYVNGAESEFLDWYLVVLFCGAS